MKVNTGSYCAKFVISLNGGSVQIGVGLDKKLKTYFLSQDSSLFNDRLQKFNWHYHTFANSVRTPNNKFTGVGQGVETNVGIAVGFCSEHARTRQVL